MWSKEKKRNVTKIVIIAACVVVCCVLIHLFGGNLIDFVKRMHGF